MGLSKTKAAIMSVETTSDGEKVTCILELGNTRRAAYFYSWVGGWKELEGQTVWVAASVKRWVTKNGIFMGMVRKCKPPTDPNHVGHASVYWPPLVADFERQIQKRRTIEAILDFEYVPPQVG
jgi:hypothetical protein